MTSMDGYDPANLDSIPSHDFANYRNYEDGTNRNWSVYFDQIKIGDKVILECKNHPDDNYNGIWGVTTVEDIVSTNCKRQKYIVFSIKNLKRFYPAVKSPLFSNGIFTIRKLKQEQKETLDSLLNL